MSRITLRKLRVTGPGKVPAELDFGADVTLITGLSNTGKTHVLECVDFSLGAGTAPREIPEADGYTDIALEIEHTDDVWTLVRRRPAPDEILRFAGPIAEWDGEQGTSIKVDIRNAPDATKTLSGFLLGLSGFDPSMPVVKNQRGQTQRLSFRTAAPFVLVREPDVIATTSPVAPPAAGGQTAARSLFRILLTGEAPSEDEIARLQQRHEDRDRAKQETVLLSELIGSLREEIEEANLSRADLQEELARIDDELATVSDAVARSGERVRGLIELRNRALQAADNARGELRTATELSDRFSLLGEHYRSDIQRLEFVREGGHFFSQIKGTSCPTCGRPWGDDAICHSDPNFVDVEQAAAAEIRKLHPRVMDLEGAIADAATAAQQANARFARERSKASSLDSEIKTVANPSASTARARVRQLGARRREVEDHLLRFRELDRYVVLMQTADARAKARVDAYRPEQTATSLVSLAGRVAALLQRWKLPAVTDVRFSLDDDDLVINGKPRAANGKGVRAVTHAAFNLGLMQHCLAAKTPHPGFVVVDTPLTTFRGPTDDIDDPELSRDLHTAFLHSLTDPEMSGQAVIIENIDPPEWLRAQAVVHYFSGPDGHGRRGFYPSGLKS